METLWGECRPLDQIEQELPGGMRTAIQLDQNFELILEENVCKWYLKENKTYVTHVTFIQGMHPIHTIPRCLYQKRSRNQSRKYSSLDLYMWTRYGLGLGLLPLPRLLHFLLFSNSFFGLVTPCWQHPLQLLVGYILNKEIRLTCSCPNALNLKSQLCNFPKVHWSKWAN